MYKLVRLKPCSYMTWLKFGYKQGVQGHLICICLSYVAMAAVPIDPVEGSGGMEGHVVVGRAPNSYQNGSGAQVGGGGGTGWQNVTVPADELDGGGRASGGGEMAEMKEMMKMLMNMMMAQNMKETTENKTRGRPRITLECKHYCRIDKSEGGDGFKKWAEEMMVTAGSQDKDLEEVMKRKEVKVAMTWK